MLLANAGGEAPITSASVPPSRKTPKSYPRHKVVIGRAPREGVDLGNVPLTGCPPRGLASNINCHRSMPTTWSDQSRRAIL